MIRKLSVVVVLVALFIFSCLISPAIAAKERFHETYDVEAGMKLELYNKNGSVTIRSWDKAYVDVSAEKRSNWGGDVTNVEIVVTIDDGTLTITTNYLVKNPRVSVMYDVHVPEDVLVSSVETSNGAIKLEGTQGNVVAETSNGEIGIEDVQGDVGVKTSNGKIEIKNIKGYVDARTSNGSVAITDVAGIVAAQASNGNIQAEIPEIQQDVRIKTSNGSITLYLSSELNADVEMKTSNGSITIHDLEIVASEISKTTLKGKIGNGGNQLDVKTSNGKIKVHKL